MNSKPEPIICLGEVCYVSKGLETPARVMARGEALALKSTADAGSDFCQAKSGCVYRDVAVPEDVQISVIDLGQSTGTGAEAFSVSVDTSCKKDEDGLACDNPLITHGFSVWTVPEATAKSLGPALLEDAVADGLPQGEDARSTDK